jgi:hypothetical protein
MIWKADRLLVGDLVYRLAEHQRDDWELGDECFLFYKGKRMMLQYADLWRSRPEFRPSRILELGMYDGGSLAFWFEQFEPERIVGLDISERGDSRYFRRYLEQGDRMERIRTYWGTDQSDRAKLQSIVAGDLGGQIDLVIDDASHLYHETKISFETLFPLLRPGGLYVIEDWSWACWSSLTEGYLPVGSELPPLVFQLVEVTGTMDKYLVGEGSAQIVRPLIANLTIFPDLVVVERGPANPPATAAGTLEEWISRSAQFSRVLEYPPKPRFAATSDNVVPARPWWRFW